MGKILAMMENLQPPTDSFYKFLAIGALAIAIVPLFYIFQEQARLRERWIDAQVELIGGGYQEGSGWPTDPVLRRAYAQREITVSQGQGLMKLVTGAGTVGGYALGISIVSFFMWWFRHQRYEDLILRLNAEKLQRETDSENSRKVAGTHDHLLLP